MTLSSFVFRYRHLSRFCLIALTCTFCFGYFAFLGKPKAATFATITVTSLADDQANNGNCTLREAIQAANTNTAVDTCTAGAAGLDLIVFNAGSGVPSIAPNSPLPDITERVTIDGSTGGATRIEINGANAGANVSGLTIFSGNSSSSQLKSLVINRFSLNGIVIQNSSNNSVENSIIGLNPAANVRQGNGGQGITISNGTNNMIGGATSADGNIISGNSLSGVEIVGDTDSHKVFNNIIGTNTVGASGLGNSQNGICLNASSNIIGSATAGNVISGNGSAGILNLQAFANVIRGNIIGANSTGTSAIPNGVGIQLEGAANATIGGAMANEGNLISGNTGAGIVLVMGADNNNIVGNLIGTQANGTSALGNGSDGISFPTGTASNTQIGGSGTAANTIAFNGGAGVSLFAGGSGNRITENSIFSNTGLGIDLGTVGVTPNDNSDADTGPNDLLNFPVITAITGNVIAASLITTVPSSDFRVEFYANASCDASGNGEGAVFIGAENPATNGSGDATFTHTYVPIAGKPVITAVAIHPASRNTSEFSNCFTPACPAITLMPAVLPPASTAASYSQTLTATGGSGPYSFSLVSGLLPNGVTLTSAGVLSGIPTQAGVFAFSVLATDVNNCTGAANYSLTVNCPPMTGMLTAPATALSGQNFSYDVTFSNPCPSGFPLNVALTIATPPNTTFQSINSIPGWTCSTPAANGTGLISCVNPTFVDPQPPKPNVPRITANFTVTLKVNPGTPVNTVINHSATATATSPGLLTNTFTAIGNTTVVANVADLSVTDSVTPPVIAGNNSTFNITVTNNTAAMAANSVVLTSQVPANTTFQSLTSPAGWTCVTPAVNGTGTITCNIASLGAGTSSFALVVKVNSNVACDVSISNTASVSSSLPDPVPANNSATATALAKTQSDLAVTVAAPANTIPDVSATYTVTVTNNGPSASSNTLMQDALPAAFSVEAINASVGSCTGIGSNTVNCNLGTLAVGATATITIKVHVPETCQTTNPTNTATVTSGNCLADPVTANNTRIDATVVQIGNLGPGACIPSSQPLNAQKPGSVLFGGVFASGASGGAAGDPGNNTAVSLTNSHPRLGVVVHLFFVDGATCSVADSFVCLTANQTTRFLMSDLDPGVVGYMMAMAVDGPAGTAGGNNTGCPISFNYLIGSARVKMTNSPRREAELASESCASEFGSPLPGCDPNKPYAEIPFDGSPQGFNKLPLVLAASSIPSRADGNDTLLMLARIDGNWGTGLKPLGNIFGILYDDTEHASSFNFNVGGCLLRTPLTNAFPRTTPRFEQAIPAGRTGWMKLWSADNAAILGAIINRHPNADTLPNAFDGGRNLHILRLNERVVVTVPVFPPSC